MLRQQKKAALLSLTALVLSTMAVRPLAASHPPTRPVSIGVNSNYEFNLARNANLGWSRLDISWREIQPTSTAWNIGPTNDRVNFALDNGQQVLGILHNVPTWLSSDGDIPPYSTTEWTAFVRRLALEFRGKIAAYEIWNEPDQKSISKDGIGWGRNIDEPPLFIDFVHAAAVEIRAQAPGTLVVAPAFMSRNDSDGADNRKRRILQQAEQTFYSDGQGSSFIDVISVHNNAGSTETALTMGTRLNYENLAYVWNYAPSLRHRPVWVTEYGWRSNAVTEAGQRQRTCEVTKTFSGYLNPASTRLNDWNVSRAFIYTIIDVTNGISNTIYRADSSPKPVVTQYLQFLPYPAVQNANNSPSCAGTGFASSVPLTAEDAGAALADLGLGDPGAAIPAGFSELAVERSPDGLSTAVLFGDSAGGTISIVVSPALGTGRSLLTDVGAEWRSGALQISISGMRDGLPIGKKAVRSVAAALDASFNRACLVETVRADENAVRRLGLSVPKAPSGFTRTAEQAEYTSPTRSCGAEASAHTPDLDFTWTFEDAAGQVIRAGIYRYGKSFDGMHSGERSLHWKGKAGARYWVAADPAVAAPDPAALRAIAESMDPAFGH